MFAPKKTAMKILMVATEASPFVSVGGAAQVVNHLSKALELSGNEVAVFIPKFGFISEEKYQLTALYEGLKVPTGDEQNPYLMCNIKTAEFPSKVKAYFLENQEYYEKRANVYGYSDDPTRWALLSRGVLEFIRLKIFIPDIIHCNDWHTGLVCNYLKSDYANDPVLSKILYIHDDPIVSSDIVGTSYSAVLDLDMTKIVDGDLVKILAWYDNEMGYSTRLVEMCEYIMKR